VNIVFAIALALTAASTTETDEAIALRFYPTALQRLDGAPVPAADRRVLVARTALDPGGPQRLVAVYSNGEQTAVSVIATDGPTLLATVIPRDMTGPRPALRVLDLDGDKRPEVIVGVQQPRGYTIDWIFRWTGSTLALIGPLDEEFPDAPHSDLTNATFLDDGSGRVLIIDQKTGDVTDDDGVRHPTSTFMMYTIANGVTAPAAPLDFFTSFCRTKGAPVAVSRSFTMPPDNLTRDLVLINGPAGHRVTSAIVFLNGQRVALPNDFSERMQRFQMHLDTLPAENSLSVEVRGDPGAILYALIQRIP
jgi:hypothetical protein